MNLNRDEVSKMNCQIPKIQPNKQQVVQTKTETKSESERN